MFEENLNFLTGCTFNAGSDQGGLNWAHLRLGMHYLATDDPNKAIISLQMVLRSSHVENITALESLADAYLQRGSFTSALKAYEKVLQLQDSLYARLQIASIKLKLGYFTQGIFHKPFAGAQIRQYVFTLWSSICTSSSFHFSVSFPF